MLSMEEVVKSLFNVTDNKGHRHIVWNLRLPRVLVAIAAGAMLGLAGAILQTVMRNPLIEPGLVGVSAGAVLSVVLAMHYWPQALLANGGISWIALLGGIVAVVMIYWLNGQRGNSASRLALTGVVATSILQSATSLLLLRKQEGLSSILLWNFGSLNGRVWDHWNHLWPWGLSLLLLSMLLARRASLLRLGEETAAGLGLSVNRTKLLLLLVAAALTAASVSVVGAIGFVGLIGPHIASQLVGKNPLLMFPASALLSAVLLTAADWAGQSVTLTLTLPGMQHHMSNLPVGAVTTLLGAPFFLYLLRKSLVRKGGGSI
ncbi:iron ABC transporter permease [Paenibacillus sp. IB182493]|uniref:Iron ABC transporter permease n=2 Tax=Paenibacillus arenilitoris TaxID=2772299 RepID=A0A927H5F2_9BACL|nr:iron ABC transporter permease [Paenibacillus arenilitoris]